jgi:hypothetical protein
VSLSVSFFSLFILLCFLIMRVIFIAEESGEAQIW